MRIREAITDVSTKVIEQVPMKLHLRGFAAHLAFGLGVAATAETL